MLRNFHAEIAADTAFDLEKKGQQGELDDADKIVENLADQLDEVAKKLKALVKKVSDSS
jgi:hypothetical protein